MGLYFILCKLQYLSLHLLNKICYYPRFWMQTAIDNTSEMGKSRFIAQLIDYLSTFIVLIALGIGLFLRWYLNDEDVVILVFAFLSLFVFAICLAMRYYFSFVTIGRILSHLWIGCLMGVVAFTDNPKYNKETAEQVMNILFLTSLTLKCFWNLFQRFSHDLVYKPILLKKSEVFELVGMAIPTFMAGIDFLALSLMVAALAVICVSIRLKSLLGVANLTILVSVTFAYFFPKLNINVNLFCLGCFVGRVTFEALADLYFSPLSTLEHWQAFLNRTGCLRKLTVLFILLLELAFCGVTAYLMPNHKEWYIVVPIFTAFATIWLAFHILYIISCWQLMNKITECNMTFTSLTDENRNMKRIMASKGVRYFALILDRLILVTMVTTILVGAVGWETKTLVNIGLFFVVLPLECMMYSLVLELGSSLGGTCTGYAMVAPVTTNRSDGGAAILPVNAVEEVSNRSTHILNMVQRFFAIHLIDNYGCDYSSSGLSAESIGPKLRSFFERRTADGPRFDTYMIYYSGDVRPNGEWALAGNGTLKLDQLLEWWRDKDIDSGARLILILDTYNSLEWVKQIKSNKDDFVAAQTFKIGKNSDPEVGSKVNIGDFTREFVHYNSDTEVQDEINWSDEERKIKAVYGVSKRWTSFKFHLPTDEDMSHYWEGNFPKLSRPLMKITTCGRNNDLCDCCCCVVGCCRRLKMAWFPPRELNTGHGFKLVRS